MEIAGSTAIVTGGSGGLGRVICRSLAEAGANVVVVYLASRDVAEEVAEQASAFGPRAMALQADVTDQASVQQMVTRTVEEFGRVDTLVNDAALVKRVPFADLDQLTMEVWQQILATNTTGPFLCMKAVAPYMLKQQRGRIVNIGSIAAFAPLGSSIAYAVSKAALTHLTRCMAVALAPHVLVNCIAPGTLEGTRATATLMASDPTHVQRGMQTAVLGRTTEMKDVVDQILTFIRSESTTGQTLAIDAGRVFH